jgi:hypothetical protein
MSCLVQETKSFHVCKSFFSFFHWSAGFPHTEEATSNEGVVAVDEGCFQPLTKTSILLWGNKLFIIFLKSLCKSFVWKVLGNKFI